MIVIGYTAGGSIEAIINGSKCFVPDDHANAHRQMIAAWEAKGNTIPAHELSRTDVLRSIKAEAARRIEAIMPMWMVAREVSGGEAIPSDIKAAAQAIRTRSDQIEQMDPLPADIGDDGLWAIGE